MLRWAVGLLVSYAVQPWTTGQYACAIANELGSGVCYTRPELRGSVILS